MRHSCKIRTQTHDRNGELMMFPSPFTYNLGVDIRDTEDRLLIYFHLNKAIDQIEKYSGHEVEVIFWELDAAYANRKSPAHEVIEALVNTHSRIQISTPDMEVGRILSKVMKQNRYLLREYFYGDDFAYYNNEYSTKGILPNGRNEVW